MKRISYFCVRPFEYLIINDTICGLVVVVVVVFIGRLSENHTYPDIHSSKNSSIFQARQTIYSQHRIYLNFFRHMVMTTVTTEYTVTPSSAMTASVHSLNLNRKSSPTARHSSRAGIRNRKR